MTVLENDNEVAPEEILVIPNHSGEPTVSDRSIVGLTSEEAEILYETVGFNELPHIEISLWSIFAEQFTGVMPYMLEASCIIALGVESWPDFAIIFAILLANGVLGFHEQLKAKESLDSLTAKMEQRIACLRDGSATQLLTRLLVPGDVILLVGGTTVPADVEWVQGDVLSIDTAALTGEPLPRKYPSEDHGKLILCGTTVVAGEAYCIVRKTGVDTEIGSSQMAISTDKATKRVSLFEERILYMVKVIIALSLIDVIIIFLIQGLLVGEFNHSVRELIASCLSIIIACIPVALPLVLQVTMALGAGKMATEFNAVVTSIPALQDIATMTILCSDKTGTLTTARISIHHDSIAVGEGFTTNDVVLYAALASNRDKKEDPIDRACITHFDRTATSDMNEAISEYKLERSIGFNPIYKRVVWIYNHSKYGRVLVAKGLPNKVIDTSDGNIDDAEFQWKVENSETVLPHVNELDTELSKAGYKTLGVSMKVGDAKWKYVGILPMIDPPRHDTSQTINNLQKAGVKVKMITGDHLNIAKETARLIGMGVNIHKGEDVRSASMIRDELVWDADGFAQVLPRDKREVVLVLKKTFGAVVGMTGDGVNDAPALSAAQCGIAVDDATDAAKNAAAIILTTPGLSAIYSAIIESRRIFRKLKAYVVYRFSATIQIVTVLSVLIFASNCPIDSLYVILLALLNDLTLLPIAYDYQVASVQPEFPNVRNIMILAIVLGFFNAGLTLLWAYVAEMTPMLAGEMSVESQCTRRTQGTVWLQLVISAELLIFSVRAPTYFWMSHWASPMLVFSVLLGCFFATVIACSARYFGAVLVTDAVYAWIYCFICLVLADLLKVYVNYLLGEKNEILDTTEEDALAKAARKAARARKAGRVPEEGAEEAEEEEPVEEEEEEEEEEIPHSTVVKLDKEKYVIAPAANAAYAAGLASSMEMGGAPSPGIDITRRQTTGHIGVSRTSSQTAIIAARTRSSQGIGTEFDIEEGRRSRTSSVGSAGETSTRTRIIMPANYESTRSSQTILRPYTPANVLSRR